jgi:hypothetical protein
MRRKIIQFSVCIAVVVGSAGASGGQVAHLKAWGIVTGILDDDAEYDLDGSVTNGSSFEADFALDLAAPDEEPAVGYGLYRFQGGGGTAKVGGYSVGIAAPGYATLSVFDNLISGGDAWRLMNFAAPLEGTVISQGLPVSLSAPQSQFLGGFALGLDDNTGRAVRSDGLLTPRLIEWPTHTFNVWVNRAGGQLIISGTLTLLAVMPQLSILS